MSIFAPEILAILAGQFPGVDIRSAADWVEHRHTHDPVSNPKAMLTAICRKRMDENLRTGRRPATRTPTHFGEREPDTDYARARMALIGLISTERLTPHEVADKLEASILPHFPHYAEQMALEIEAMRRYGVNGDWLPVHDETMRQWRASPAGQRTQQRNEATAEDEYNRPGTSTD